MAWYNAGSELTVFTERRVMIMFARYRKAIAAFLGAGAASFFTALATDPGVTTDEWKTIILAVLGAVGLTYAAPRNAEPQSYRDRTAR